MLIEKARALLNAADVFYGPDEDEPESAQTLNMNDTWGWATSLGVYVPDDKLVEVAALFNRYGTCGLLYWVSEQPEQMRSEFEDINRFVDFVRHEEALRMAEPSSSKRAYMKVEYTLGGKMDEKPSAAEQAALNLSLPTHVHKQVVERALKQDAGAAQVSTNKTDWEETDRLDAFGTFGGRIIPYNGVWKIMLSETNCELWSLKTKEDAEAKFADAVKKSGYSDAENPLLLAQSRAENAAAKETP